MHHTCLIPIWIVVYRRQWLYLTLCISRILPGGDIFSLDIKIYLYLNICAHSVADSRPGHRVYSTARSFWYMTLVRVDNAPCKKTGEFSLDLAEMRPVNVVTLLLCHLKRPLRYGGYLCNQIQQNNVEMC